MGLGNLEEEERDNPELILTPAREDALAEWREDKTGWAFLTARDPDTGEPVIKTIDQRDKAQPVKEFPAHLDYLHFLCDLLTNEPKLVIEKASQMVITTTIILYYAIKCALSDGQKVLFSKHKELEAELIISEKIRDPWALMPLWLQRQLIASAKPKNRVIFRRQDSVVESSILGLTENAAAAEARGQTYHTGLIDEAEFQELLRDLITAMLPRCGQLIFWSTPSRGGDGVQVFREYLADDPITVRKHPVLWATRKKWAGLQGMSVRRNEDRNFTIARIEHSADPTKRGRAWEERTSREYPSLAEFKREMKIDRTSNAGKPFYPQFSENPRRYLVRCDEIPKNAPILRGWDFGGSNPACVWGTWSKKSKRFWVLRELLGFDIDTYQFRDLCKYLSGELSLDSLKPHPRALQILTEQLPQERSYPEPPWFAPGYRFLDFAGHEAVMTGRGLTRAGEAKTAAEILSLGDIHLYAAYTRQTNRTDIINGLSRLREDGWPGLLLDPSCPLLIKGLSTGIVFAPATTSNPDPSEPKKDAIYSHLHEALGYVLTNVVRLEDADYFQASVGEDGRIMMSPPPDDIGQVLSYLTEGR
jgi:hypothetical protein